MKTPSHDHVIPRQGNYVEIWGMKTLCILSLFLLPLSICQAQTALQDSWITNRKVNHIATGDGKVMLMGEFDWFGPAYYGGTASFSNTLVEDESFPKIKEEVLTAISDDAGGWYVGTRGRSGTSESKIIHILANKTIEEIPITLDGSFTTINTLVKSGSILYFGGYFQSVNGTTRNSAAAINLTNNILTGWNPNVDVNGYINVLTISGSTVYAGGSFSAIGGQARTHVAALDATTGLATSWNVTITTGSFTEVNTILVNAGVVYIGGRFTNVNAAAPTRRNFAAVNAATAALETFNPRPDGTVRTLLLDGPMLYMAGGFDRVLGVTRFRVARIELATSTLTPFELVFFSNTHSNFFGFDQVNAIGIDGNKLFIGGTFPRVNGEQQPHLAVVDKVTGVLEPSDDKKIYGEVNTLLVNGGNIFVGGYIIGHLGTAVNGIAALDETTGAGIPGWTDQIPTPPEDEYYEDFDFHYQEGRMYYYLNISDGTTRIGALNSDDGSVINSWSVTINRHIGGWAFSDDALYLADQGTTAMTINGQTRNRFAAVNLETGALLPFTINFPLALDEHTINSMALQNNTLYVAGDFSFTENSSERNSFTAFDATNGALLPWSPLIDEFLDSSKSKIAAVTNSQIYLLGNGGNEIVRRVHPVTGAVDNWAPQQTGIRTIAVHNNSIFVGGSFSPGLVHLDGTTGQPAAWQPNFKDVEDLEGWIGAIAVAGGKLLVAGNFYYIINGIQRYYYAEYLLPTSTKSAPTTTGASGCSPSTIILNATGGTSGQYRWYTVATGGTAITGQTNSSYTTPSLTTSTTYFVSIDNATCESARTSVVATITGPCAQPPVIITAPLSTSVGGTVTIDLKPLIITSGTLDINSIVLTVPPSSGAIATITNGVLTISYQGIAFTGKEIFSIRACDNNGACSTQQFEIEVAGDVVVYNALSPNGANPVFTIEYIELIPETKNNLVTIFDRWQNEVWSASNYNNSSVVFKGVSNSGSDLPTGIYFYKIEFASGKKMQTGFISLKR